MENWKHFAVAFGILLAVLTAAYRTEGHLPMRSRAARGTGAAEGRAWVIQCSRAAQLSGGEQ